jgi:uncharacterized protein (DUF2147 family)
MRFLVLAVATAMAVAAAGGAMAQGKSYAGKAAPPAANAAVGFEVLKGDWVRPDGGYVISIAKVGAGGEIEATYYNPRQLPFAKALATRDGTALRVSLELQAGGYAGSTYELAYDAATDRLTGIYYQAVQRQKYEVYFTRK